MSKDQLTMKEEPLESDADLSSSDASTILNVDKRKPLAAPSSSNLLSATIDPEPRNNNTPSSRVVKSTKQPTSRRNIKIDRSEGYEVGEATVPEGKPSHNKAIRSRPNHREDSSPGDKVETSKPRGKTRNSVSRNDTPKVEMKESLEPKTRRQSSRRRSKNEFQDEEMHDIGNTTSSRRRFSSNNAMVAPSDEEMEDVDYLESRRKAKPKSARNTAAKEEIEYMEDDPINPKAKTKISKSKGTKRKASPESWLVEAILAKGFVPHKGSNGVSVWCYYVKWKDFGHEENSWEPVGSLRSNKKGAGDSLSQMCRAFEDRISKA